MIKETNNNTEEGIQLAHSAHLANFVTFRLNSSSFFLFIFYLSLQKFELFHSYLRHCR